jgi:hypothetical protein
MSALPPKADIGVRNWDVRFVPKSGHSAPQPDLVLFDHLVGTSKQHGRNGKAESGRCLAGRRVRFSSVALPAALRVVHPSAFYPRRLPRDGIGRRCWVHRS